MLRINNDLLNDLVLSVKNQNLHVLNVIVRQDGNIIAKYDFEEEKPTLLWSVSKTFTSMAVGIAINEGYFKINDYVIDFFPDIPNVCISEYLKKMTIHNLLCLGTGHAECPVLKADWSDGKDWDIFQLFLDEPIVFEPGIHFTYNNSATYMLSRIISITTRNNLDEYLDEKVFQQLDIPKPKWDTCTKGIPLGFSGLYLTADHHQGYGYQMWMNLYPNSYRMDGLYGQYVVMLPDKNAVITYISNEPQNMTGVLELAWDTLIDKL